MCRDFWWSRVWDGNAIWCEHFRHQLSLQTNIVHERNHRNIASTALEPTRKHVETFSFPICFPGLYVAFPIHQKIFDNGVHWPNNMGKSNFFSAIYGCLSVDDLTQKYNSGKTFSVSVFWIIDFYLPRGLGPGASKAFALLSSFFAFAVGGKQQAEAVQSSFISATHSECRSRLAFASFSGRDFFLSPMV